MMYRRHTQGSTLVIVLILSTIMLLLAAALMQTVNSMYRDNMSRHHTKLAEEAAEAGAAYAKACIELSHRVQTWGPAASGGAKPNLTPGSDCAGTANAYPANQYVYTDDHVQTRFVVGDLEEHTIASVIISVTGYAERKRPGSNDVVKTYTHVIKKTIVWVADYTAQKSASGLRRTCGLMSYNVYCWGENIYGQLGDGTTNDSLVPVRVVRENHPTGIGSYNVIDLVAGSHGNCLLIETGEVYCWGRNNHGQLGIGANVPSYMSVPVKVTGLDGQTIVKLGVTGATYCALTDTNRLYCWGSNTRGQVGNNSTIRRTTPILIGGPNGGYGALNGRAVTSVSDAGAFNTHMCAIADGNAYCWGSNDFGELGNNPSGSGPWADQRTPVAVYTGGVLSGKTVFSISGDGDGYGTQTDPHTCAAAYTSTPADARAYCWGSHARGNLGSNAPIGGSYKAPVAVWTGGVMANTTVTEVATTAIGGCAIAHPTSGTIEDSNAYCWGGFDTRGDGGSGPIVRPVLVADTAGLFASNRVHGIAGGAFRACAIVSNKSYCWGANGYGQIGDGTTVHRRQPTESLFLRPLNNEFIF